MIPGHCLARCRINPQSHPVLSQTRNIDGPHYTQKMA